MILKRSVLLLADVLSYVWRLFPARMRLEIITGIFILESRGPTAKLGFSQIFSVKDRLEWVINERAMAYGEGEHPKHKLTNYHNFFISKIQPGERVLDIGCGYGAVARSVAKALPDTYVTGLDNNPKQILRACASDNPPNLCFVVADANEKMISGEWDVVILSNVLEHITDRQALLEVIKNIDCLKKILIRVPLFERDWQMPLRKDLGLNYYSDPDHKIEHTFSEFVKEISQAGYSIEEIQTLWGEIWADCRPLLSASR